MSGNEIVGGGFVAGTQRVDTDTEAAVRRAQEVVGLYGDPDVTWGISLEVRFTEPIDLKGVEDRLATMVSQYPHLGRLPSLQRVRVESWASTREESASADFADGRLVRFLVCSEGRRLFVTVHHGVCDGLGMTALASAFVGSPLVSSAQGVGQRRSSRGFVLSSFVRLGEALLNPPARFSGSGKGSDHPPPESLLQETATLGRVNSAAVCAALARVYAAWPRDRSSGGRRFLVVMGASRRAPGEARTPDRQTAYLRIPLKVWWDVERVTVAIRAVDPEPDFPETSAGGVGPMVMRALKGRLGYTVNVSNLGLVTGENLQSVAVFPAVNGPQAVGVGVVSTARGTTVSLRTRRTDFGEDEARRLLRGVLDELR